MLFTELRFFIFFIVAFSIYWLLSNNKHRLFWLLLCSYTFYGAWDARFLSLIILSTVVDYLIGIRLGNTTNQTIRKRLVTLSLAVNLGILGFFKYFNFFTDSAIDFFNLIGIPANSTTLNIILPVGISFYTFQTLSYSLDVYFGNLKPCTKLLNFAVFVSFFPQLVAGPIVRAIDFLPQLETKRNFGSVLVRPLLLLFLVGFIKKACISDNLSPIVDSFFSAPGDYTVLSAWLGVILYAVQIYCDFSGYSDMAIATAGFLGYELCLNFDFPYFSSSVTEFWRKWHISLSTWLRDYLYIPLGGNRGTKLFTYRNLMLTMLLGGLWHGAGWNFVIWGALHGLALIVNREWSKITKRLFGSQPHKFWQPISRLFFSLLTFYWVCLAWIFFRATSFSDATEIVKSFVLLRSDGSQQLNYYLFLLLGGLIVFHYGASRRLLARWWKALPNWSFFLIFGSLVSIAIFAIAPSYTSFIYFQF